MNTVSDTDGRGSVKQIILVEDDAWLAEMYEQALDGLADTQLRVAQSADRTLALLDERSADLIILDMFLPGHNGIELLHELSSYADTSSLPVIILSAVAEHDFALSREQWRQYNVVQYLYKPHTKPHTLAAAVQKQLLEQAGV